MLHFQKSTLIKASLEVVWRFHEQRDVLQKLTPPWQSVQVLRREGGLGIGAMTEFRLFFGPIPVRWLARHIECEPYHLFTDKQMEGPMQAWIHRHQFKTEKRQTRLTDSIDYELPGGWLVNFLLGWWVDWQLQRLFTYRHEVTKRECEK